MSFTHLPSNAGRRIYNKRGLEIYLSKDERNVYKFSSSDLSREYDMMNLVQSSYTVSAINYIETDNWNCLIMPAYLEGDAFTLIEKKETSEQITKQIIYDVIKGLAHLESEHIIHHDIKPENVFLYKKGKTTHAIIGDFEYAERVGEEKIELGGSLLYAAPEILMEAPYSYNSDIWSVGVFMAVFLTHSMPFYGPNKSIVLNQIFRKRILLSNELSQAQDLLDKLLCIDPNHRITAAEALQHPWFNDIEQLNLAIQDDVNQSNN